MKKIISRLFVSMLLALCGTAGISAADYSGTLPVMFVNTDGGAEITSKETYVTGTYWLDPMGDSSIKAIGSEASPLPLQIRGRGNYTWTGFDKKPYRLKLDSKAPLMGMTSSKHFALLAHADDNKGFLRNAVGFQLSRLIGMRWTPADKPVELVLNGKYQGIYFLTETIRVDKNRVNIVEQPDLATDPEVITGGWLVEIDNYDSDPHITIKERDGKNIIFTYKTPEELSQPQFGYLIGQMTTINSEIYSTDKSDCRWAQHVDLKELARFYIVQELVDNYESFHGSCYLYKQQGEDEKWFFGPVWDFGSSFFENKTQHIYEGRPYDLTWIKEMMTFPQFQEVVRQTWEDFYNGSFSEIYSYIDTYTARIKDGAAADAARWPQYGNSDLDLKASEVSGKLRGAAAYLNREFGIETTETVNVYFRNTPGWEKVCAYMWSTGGGFRFYLNDWPGTVMEKCVLNGEELLHVSVAAPEGIADDAQIIFNNGGSGNGNQTADLKFVNNSIYDFEGYSGPAGIGDIEAENGITVGCVGGKAVVTMSHGGTVRVSTLGGCVTTYDLPAGETVLDLIPGFYIIEGKKVAVTGR